MPPTSPQTGGTRLRAGVLPTENPAGGLRGIPYSDNVDIRIGIANSPREIGFESSQSPAEIEKIVAAALDSDAKFFKLADEKGRVYLIPTASFGYLEVGAEESRRVGFVA